VGAMGSRRSDRERRAALREAGVSGEALARLRSPIGLDLGAVTPAEVGVAILAESLAVRANRGSVGPLRDGEGPLHPSTSCARALPRPSGPGPEPAVQAPPARGGVEGCTL